MSDLIAAAIDAELEQLQARVDVLVRAKELLGEEAQTPPSKRHAEKGGKQPVKRPKPKAAKEGEQRPRKGKAARPGRGNGPSAQRAAERKAKALALLAQGKTPKEVAESLGVSSSAIYLYQKHAK
jgi:DNA-binding NarL/FixJ family response regulator